MPALRFQTPTREEKWAFLSANGENLSQFHQGAGEDATLDFFRIIQGIPQYSLLIIDEVEASLHPRAQRRLTRFLLWLARQRRIQVILSTHSPYVLEELPPEARVQLLGVLGDENRLPYRSIAVVDGGETVSRGCITLPGDSAPERVVYDSLKLRQWQNIPARFRNWAGILLQALEDAMLEPDHHRWNELVGNVTHKSARSVWEILTKLTNARAKLSRKRRGRQSRRPFSHASRVIKATN